LEGLDSKEWKSVVLPKIYEEKMQKLEAELEKKVRVLLSCSITMITGHFGFVWEQNSGREIT